MLNHYHKSNVNSLC